MIDINKDGYTYRLSVEPEMDGPEGYFDSGIPEYDAADVADIRERMEWSEWAWCVVRVECFRDDVPEVTAVDYLGACSYDDTQDFIANSGYFDDMCATTRAEVDKRLTELGAILCEAR